MTDAEGMRRALDACREGIRAGQSPFGAAIVRDGVVVAVRHNTVRLDTDSTAHAEMNALRSACRTLGTYDLSGTVLYSTVEPCPMCLAACHWARVGRVVFGASIADAQAAGFNELSVPAAELARMGGSPMQVEGGLLREVCAAMFDEWKAAGLAGNTY